MGSPAPAPAPAPASASALRLDDKVLVSKRATLVEDKLMDKTTAKKIFLGSPISFTFKSGTGGINEDISDEDLKTYFSQYGVVTNVS